MGHVAERKRRGWCSARPKGGVRQWSFLYPACRFEFGLPAPLGSGNLDVVVSALLHRDHRYLLTNVPAGIILSAGENSSVLFVLSHWPYNSSRIPHSFPLPSKEQINEPRRLQSWWYQRHRPSALIFELRPYWSSNAEGRVHSVRLPWSYLGIRASVFRRIWNWWSNVLSRWWSVLGSRRFALLGNCEWYSLG